MRKSTQLRKLNESREGYKIYVTVRKPNLARSRKANREQRR